MLKPGHASLSARLSKGHCLPYSNEHHFTHFKDHSKIFVSLSISDCVQGME